MRDFISNEYIFVQRAHINSQYQPLQNDLTFNPLLGAFTVC